MGMGEDRPDRMTPARTSDRGERAPATDLGAAEVTLVAGRLGPAARMATSGLSLFLIVFVVYVVSPIQQVGFDPSFVPLTAESLFARGDLDLDEFDPELLAGHPLTTTSDDETTWGVHAEAAQVAERRADGTSSFDYFPWFTSLFLVPAVAATELLEVLGIGGGFDAALEGRGFAAEHQATAALLTALAAVCFMCATRRALTGSVTRRRALAFAAGCTFAFATSAWSIASRAMWQHTPSLLFVAVSLWLGACLCWPGDRFGASTRIARSAAAGLGASLACAVVARPTNVWLAGALAVWVLVSRRSLAPWFGLGAAAVVGAFVGANLALLGAPIPLYYSTSRLAFHHEMAQAFAAQWVSPSRGLLWTTPIVLLAVPGVIIGLRDTQRRAFVVALAVSAVGLAISVSAFEHWWAGHSVGARFMTDAVPALLLLAVIAVDRAIPRHRGELRGSLPALAAILVLLVPSILFHAAASVRPAAGCWNVEPVDVDANHARIWGVADSQPVTVLGDLVGGRTASSCAS